MGIHDRTWLMFDGDLPESVALQVTADPADPGVQACLVTAAALCGRFADCTRINVDEAAYQFPGGDRLESVLVREVGAIGNEFERGAPEGGEDATLVVGEARPEETVSVGFQDSTVSISRAETTSCTGSPLEGTLAGGIAAWSLFLEGADREVPLPETGTKKLELPSTTALEEVDSILLIGAGGVGSNVAYLLPFLGFEGRVDVVDFDHVEKSNLGRSLPYTGEHIREDEEPPGELKAPVLAERLRVRGIEAEGHVCGFREFVEDERPDHELWMMLANERQVWRPVQDNFPPRVVSGATSPEWNVAGTRHVPFEDSCVGCYWGVHDDQGEELSFGCAEAEPDREGESEDEQSTEQGVLPFMGPLAAALCLVQAGTGPNQRNFLKLHTTQSRLALERLNLGRRPGCICETQSATVHQTFL